MVANIPPLLMGLPCGASGEPVFSSAMGVMNQLPPRMASSCSPLALTAKPVRLLKISSVLRFSVVNRQSERIGAPPSLETRPTGLPSARKRTPVLPTCRST